jgi:hypothetical protein
MARARGARARAADHRTLLSSVGQAALAAWVATQTRRSKGELVWTSVFQGAGERLIESSISAPRHAAASAASARRR